MIAGLPAGVDYLGNEWMPNTKYASGGAGYLLSPSAAGILSDRLVKPTGAEDLLVGKVLREAGIEMRKDHRFIAYANETLRPLPENDLITAHACSIPWATHDDLWLNPTASNRKVVA